jgi:hypothetical protein
MPDVHADVQCFDFHDGNLTTACRAVASSEGGMDADAHGFLGSREGREVGEEKFTEPSHPSRSSRDNNFGCDATPAKNQGDKVLKRR